MEDRDRVRAYRAIMDMRHCTVDEIAHLTDLPEHEISGVLAELVRDGIARESVREGRKTRYDIDHAQAPLLARRAADLIVRLRGVF